MQTTQEMYKYDIKHMAKLHIRLANKGRLSRILSLPLFFCLNLDASHKI